MGMKVCDIAMESDYVEHTHKDLLTGIAVKIKGE
jgi:hypothetical protein